MERCRDSSCKKTKCLPPCACLWYGRIIAHRDYGLQYRTITARVGRDAMTVFRIWNRWVQEDHVEHHAGSQRLSITKNRVEDMLPTWLYWIIQLCHKHWVEKWGRSQDKFLFKRFDNVSISMDCHTVSLKIMDLAIFDATSQTGVSLMVYLTTNLDLRIAWHCIFRRISILLTASWWSHPCLAASWRMHVAMVHSISLHEPVTWSDGMECHWMHPSVTSCSHWQHFVLWALYFLSLKAYGSTL